MHRMSAPLRDTKRCSELATVLRTGALRSALFGDLERRYVATV